MVKRIVIVGGGFGGMKTFLLLSKLFSKQQEVELTLVNDLNYFIFTPLLHEVATGNLAPGDIITPLPELGIGPNRQFVVSKAEEIRLEEKKVITKRGEINFDYLVLALGSETNFYHTPGAEEFSLPLKDLDDAARIKNKIIKQFEKAQCLTSEAEIKKALSFIIVGGGPTGIELAGELADFCRQTFAKLYDQNLIAHARIMVLQKDGQILPQFSKQLQRRALDILARRGIEVMVSTGVQMVNQDGVKLDSDHQLEAETVIWTAGVKPKMINFDQPVKQESGRLIVDEKLRLIGWPDIFVLGDQALFLDQKTNQALPMLAQVADRQANLVARNIFNQLNNLPLKDFHYRSRGNLLSLGSWRGVGEISGLHFAGRLAWVLWRLVYASKMPTWRKKIRVLVDWILDIFGPRDVSALPFSESNSHV